MSVKPWDLLNKNNYTDEELSKSRMDICNECPSLIQLTKMCKECGCFMLMKTKLKEATCPLGKWFKEEGVL
jgi:hypothetical protein